MSNFENFTEQATARGKSVLGCVADILESMTEQNLSLAGEIAGLAVSQVRLPAEAAGLSDLGERQRDAYRKFGDVLKDYGQGIASHVREIPGQLVDSWNVEPAKESAPSAGPARKKTTRKSNARRATKK